MNEYIQITFSPCSNEQTDILVAELAEKGFEGFEENENGLKAFIPADSYNETDITGIAQQQNITFSKTIIQETNWNREWESNFHPVIIGDFVAVRADFHEPVQGVKHEIIITPKMSFGTGHHTTTRMMIEQMKEIDFNGKSVFDFGTGTGLLAILAEKLGAKKIIAIDNDDWSIENSRENIQRNNCSGIEINKAETADQGGSFDIVLANINKNVILTNFDVLVNQLSPGGVLLISGLLKGDEHDVFHISDAYSFQLIQTSVRDNWLCLRFSC